MSTVSIDYSHQERSARTKVMAGRLAIGEATICMGEVISKDTFLQICAEEWDALERRLENAVPQHAIMRL